MPFAAFSQRARARKAARLRRLRPAFFCPRQRQAAIPCGTAVQRRRSSIPYNDRVDQRRGEVPSFAVSIRGIPKGGRNRNLPPFGVLSLFVHFLFARAKRKWTLTGPFSSKSTLTEIRQGAFGLCCVWVGVCRVNGDPCGESGLREDLCSDDNAFSREYFVYFKKKRRRQGANHPQDAEGVWVGVCPYSYRPLSFIRCS